ncbi:efflux RND transporter periplasmic adaptor subunit [Endozoicomonas sp. G2_1]|uniref:efflux RND transporter periplasmic adaptor subunit n=1 Tax=Endozoicomonas sp. G2_1 TaxID=2821091 RepID=UPI001ADB86BC|nr:efflux RND transporter periplasmic adaptor subunit [Endozoicomonas sp. G2_1]MBO9489846.1 efflux RND transporter periplasmic adaptor subunit [Endozoicomonas sp. G2_1]
MDKPIVKSPRKTQLKLGMTLTIILVLCIYLGVFNNLDTLKVDAREMQTYTTHKGDFSEYLPIIGKVFPIRTVYLDVVQGGRVEEIFVDDGQYVEKGDLILRLSNDRLLQNSINNESRFIENMNSLRDREFRLSTQKLNLREQLLEYEYRVSRLQKELNRLNSVENSYVVQKDIDNTTDEFNYYISKRDILKKRITLEDDLRKKQLQQIQTSISQVDRNLDLIQQTLNNLNVKAPISGHLSTLKTELGRNIQQGENIGQIDIISKYLIKSEVDQYYISRVFIGQNAELKFNNQHINLKIKKVYPEVINDKFHIDFEFQGKIPKNLKSGQSLNINLILSSSDDRLLLSKGKYMQQTGAKWIFKIINDGQAAIKQSIQIGRQNPKYFEVLSGLEEGDKVIISDYKTFKGYEVINIE